MTLFERLNITFDPDGNATISREKLQRLIQIVKSERIFSDEGIFPDDCYVLVDRNGNDFYPFPLAMYEEWQKDGSFEKGDYLYKMNLIQKF
jgi:hypothetical protein